MNFYFKKFKERRTPLSLGSSINVLKYLKLRVLRASSAEIGTKSKERMKIVYETKRRGLNYFSHPNWSSLIYYLPDLHLHYYYTY
jgi:hypothetical protein